MSYSNELGFIFIVNYPYLVTKPEDDSSHIIDRLKDFKKGIFNFSQYNPHDKVSIWFVSCFGDPTSPDTKVTKLKLAADGKSFDYDQDKTMTFGSVNLGNKDIISVILTYIVKTADASRYVFFLYNHSSAFGMFNNDPRNSVVSTRLQVKPPPEPTFVNVAAQTFFTADEISAAYKWNDLVLDSLNKKKAMKNTNRGAEQDCKPIMREEVSKDYLGDMLTNAELLIALSKAIYMNDYDCDDPPRIEILFSAGCYALNIDLAYALSGVVHYLVGAESIMPCIGYDYPSIVNELIGQLDTCSSVDIQYDEVICNTMKSFGKEYDYNIPEQRDWMKATYVTAVNCDKLPSIRDLINELSFQLMGGGESTLLNLRQARVRCSDMTNTYFVDSLGLYDIGELCSQIKAFIPATLTICDKIILALSEIRLDCAFYQNELANPGLVFSGLSIYFPIDVEDGNNKIAYTSFYSDVSATESFFSRESYWSMLMAVFLRYKTLIDKPANNNFRSLNIS